MALLHGCTITGAYWASRLYKPEEYKRGTPAARYAKIHLHDGGVLVLDSWQVSTNKRFLSGRGQAYDADRNLLGGADQPYSLPLEKIALIQTTDPKSLQHSGTMLLSVAAGVTTAFAMLCLANPKVCFGSCPTVYGAEGPSGPILAEGFSASIARSLEATDVDWLAGVRAVNGLVHLTLTNEAYETHAIRWMDLLAVQAQPGQQIVRSGAEFLAVGASLPPLQCRSPSAGDCLEAVRAADRSEYSALTDAHDLAHPEVLELQVPAVAGPAGLVVVVRNSLVNTFVFYQAWAWLGHRASDWLVQLDRMGPRGAEAFWRVIAALGELRVEVQGRGGHWLEVGTYSEVGPLAQEQIVLALPRDLGPGPWRVRLTMAQGAYRIDQVAVVPLLGPQPPRRIAVQQVQGDGDPQALANLLDRQNFLVTYPGDSYRLTYADPLGDGDTHYFLESRGWYVEWQHPGWPEQPDEGRFLRLLVDPAEALRQLAPAYKEVEAGYERAFWSSRFRKGAP